MATTGDQTDALQRDRVITDYKRKPGPKPKPKKMTIKQFEKMLKK